MINKGLVSLQLAAFLMMAFYLSTVQADGSTIGKIYTPYVDQLGTEIEWEFRDSFLTREANQRSYRLGIGSSITETIYGEISLLAEQGDYHGNGNQDLEVEGYELELKWQLSEQGEYAADYGVMFELERESDIDTWEAATTLLVSKEFGRWTGTANAALIYESIKNLHSEWETSLALQTKYRLRESFEPALEYFKSDQSSGIGPVITGLFRVGIAKKVRWELGVIWELADSPIDKSIKAGLEFDF